MWFIAESVVCGLYLHETIGIINEKPLKMFDFTGKSYNNFLSVLNKFTESSII